MTKNPRLPWLPGGSALKLDFSFVDDALDNGTVRFKKIKQLFEY
jgi:hypothetical protein